jgi:catechol 2,3-dioxygenase-like lactoylglutathione lyase family enzyme
MPVTGIDKKVLTQVCIIVRDVEASTARYAEILGIDMSPNFQTTLLHDHTHATYFGQPTDARARLSALDIGHLQFELLQPLEPPSSWGDFLDQHGEGIHHVAFFVPKTDVAAESFKEQGYVITQQGLFTGQTGMYTYLDTDKDMGVVIELLEHFGGSPELNGLPFPADKGLGTEIVCQVGIIVSDIDQAVKRYGEVLGLSPVWRETTQGYAVTKTTYHGQPSEATAKLAFFSAGQVQIELIEPDNQPSVWRDFLDQNGDGAHHIAFQVADTQHAIDYLAQFGITVTQQGLYSDGSGVYTYMDSQKQLGTTIELLQSFKR